MRDLKKHATAHGQTLSSAIEDAVREFLARTVSSELRQKAPSFRVITFRGRLRPGVDLDHSAALLDEMVGTTAARGAGRRLRDNQ